MDIVILAGGKCPPDLAEVSGVEDRANIPFGDRTCLQIVAEALGEFGDLVVVGGPEVKGTRQTQSGKTFIESVALGLEQVKSDRMLIATVDIPCLTREAVGDFMAASDPAALNYPIIRAEDCEQEFPGMKRTTLRLREGVFTGGNLGLVPTETMRRAIPVLEHAYAHRKSPLKLAQLVGLDTMLRLVMGKLAPKTLTIPALESSVGRFLKIPVKAVITSHPSIGADIDSAEQYRALLALKNLG